MQKSFILIACLFVWVSSAAQQYPFVYYTPKDGLVNSRVRTIKQDSKGRIYFLTFGGLSMYDGVRFTNYRLQDGLANELVNDLIEVAPDSLLIATNTNKLNTIVNGKMGIYKTKDNFYPLINRLIRTKDGQLYAAADDGLFQLDHQTFKRLRLVDQDNKDIGFDLDKMVEWKNYLLIIPWNGGRKERMILYDRNRKKVTDIFSLEASSAESDKDGLIWITSNSGIKQLDTVALKMGKIVEIPLAKRYANLAEHKSMNIFFDLPGNVWLYSGHQILKFTDRGEEKVISPEQGLQMGNILAIYEDLEGIIWMATDGNGVLKMRGSNIELLNNLPPAYPLSAWAIKQNEDTTWLCNNAGNTIYRVVNNVVKEFSPRDKQVWGNIYLSGSKLYLVNDTWVNCIENKDLASSYEHPRKVVDAGKDHYRLGNGIIDKNGTIIQYVKKTDTTFYICAYKDDKLLMELKLPYADQVSIDGQGRIWTASRNNHILVYSVHPEEPDRYLQLLKDFSTELPDLAPRAIHIDRDNIVWVGSRFNGIFRLEFRDLQLVSSTQFSTRNGLTDNFVYFINSDSDRNVWVGTQSGLDKIFLKNGQYLVSNISKSNNFFQSIQQIGVSSDNVVWAVTGEGTILRVNPTHFKFPLTAPSLLLTSLRVNNQEYNEKINRFSFRENNFSFTVAAPSFTDEKSIVYSYQLEGSGNDHFSPYSPNPNFNLYNLSPGKYTLIAKAEFPEAIYLPVTTRYTFTILPPWWQTWWFRLLSLAFLVSIALVFVRVYTRRKLEKQRFLLEQKQVVEKERTRIATDMHDDLGAGLSRIKFLSETIGIKKQQQLPIEEDITKIREYAHEMIDKMGEIVWALNEKNDSISDLLSYTRAYAVEYLSQNGIRCIVTVPELLPSIFVSGEFRRNIFLAVKECLHNVVKHSQANQVRIDIEMTPVLRITIEDDGIGFNPENLRPFSNGITNMKKRMHDIGGNFEVTTDNGTKIILTAPRSS